MATPKFRAEIDLFTSFVSDTYKSDLKRKTRAVVFLHQNNSDLAAGLEMIGYKVITANPRNTITNTIALAKNARKLGINAYIIDSMVMENGELQAPFSLIGYIRVYDPYTPVLALSYDTNPESIQSAFRYGATSYLTRPQELDVVAAVVDGLVANNAVIDEATERIDISRGLNKAVEMIKISNSLYLDYAGKRLAFLDNDGEFTFSEEIAESVVSVLHCLIANQDKRLSAVLIGRIMGSIQDGMNWRDERRVVDKVSENLSSIKRLLARYDKYKTVKLSSVRRYGTTLEIVPPDPDAMRAYDVDKAAAKGKKANVKAGFSLVSLLEQNNSVHAAEPETPEERHELEHEVTLEELM